MSVVKSYSVKYIQKQVCNRMHCTHCKKPSLPMESLKKKLPISLNQEIEHKCLKGS